MRHSIQRSIFRAAFAVGMICSHYQVAYSVSWKEFLAPHAGVCFLHDLDWERFGSFSIRPEAESKSIVESAPLARTRIPMQRDFDECAAAAKRFEIETQVKCLWGYVTRSAGDFQKKTIDTTSRFNAAWRGLVVSIAQQTGRVSNTTVHPELAPITRVESTTLSAVAGNGVIVTEDDFFDDAVLNWNWNDERCGDSLPSDRSFTDPVSTVDHLPHRDRPNVFVYTLDKSDEAGEEIIVADDSGIIAEASGFSDEESAPSIEPSRNVWQVGVDPVCPELTSSFQVAAFGNSETCFSESEAIATVIKVKEVNEVSALLQRSESVAFAQLEDAGVGHCTMDSPDVSLDASGSHPNAEKLEMISKIRDCIHQVLPRWTPSSNPWQLGQLDADPTTTSEALGSVYRYSRDDLRYANRLVERIFSSVVQNHSLTEIRSLDHVPDLPTMFLPLTVSQKIALEFIQKRMLLPANQWRLIASKSLARQLRSFGQTMVDASLKMEQQATNLEVAYRQDDKTVK